MKLCGETGETDSILLGSFVNASIVNRIKQRLVHVFDSPSDKRMPLNYTLQGKVRQKKTRKWNEGP